MIARAHSNEEHAVKAHKDMSKLTEKHAIEHKRKYCQYCIYGKLWSSRSVKEMTCDYLTMTGKMRPINFEDCTGYRKEDK